MKELITGNAAAAWAAKLAKADYIPVYPITPATEIIETLAEWKAQDKIKSTFVSFDSEHSVMSAAVGAAASGARVYTATSSQGLLLMHEVLYITSGMRLPIVMNNVSRCISSPVGLWSDHNDFLSMLNTGWLMFHAQDNQEVLDATLMAFKIAENNKVQLPAVVNMDGYVLSFTEEPVEIPLQADVDKFLGKKAFENSLANEKPIAFGSAVLSPEYYTYFKEQQHRAQLNALEVIEKVGKEFEKKFGRKYSLIDTYATDDAEIILVTQGSISTTAKAEIMELRKEGHSVGLLRLRVLRPWPRDEIHKVLKNAKAVAVIDKNISPGLGGIIYPHIKECLWESDVQLSSFILGLGGKPEAKDQFKHIYLQTKKDLEVKKEKTWFL